MARPKGITAWNKGLTKDTDSRVAKLSRKRPPRTAEHKKKIADAKRGKPMPPSFYEKMRASGAWERPNSGQFKKGNKPKNTGVRSGKYTISKWHSDYEYAISIRPDCCDICKTPEKDLRKKLAFDHDHATDRFRGWLCSNCNVTLGLMKDDVNRLQALIDYLTK